MPFMHNRGAVARTLDYLKKGEMMLENHVKVLLFSFNYDKVLKSAPPRHAGLYNFVFWHLPQLQYKNPEVQIITLNKLTPLPWIKAYYDNDTDLTIDCDNKCREDILHHIKNVLGIQHKDIEAEERERVAQENMKTASFGEKTNRHCICEVPGQYPCPGWFRFPEEMTGKGRMKRAAEQE